MSSQLNKSLEIINELSRQLLSQFNLQIEDLEYGKKNQPLLDTSKVDIAIDVRKYSDEQLAKLVTERHSLIHLLFKNYNQEQLSVELSLINEMVSLDNQLTSKSQRNKQYLATNVLKFKKNKKVVSLYQKL